MVGGLGVACAGVVAVGDGFGGEGEGGVSWGEDMGSWRLLQLGSREGGARGLNLVM